jgi:hypothetical protein
VPISWQKRIFSISAKDKVHLRVADSAACALGTHHRTGSPTERQPCPQTPKSCWPSILPRATLYYTIRRRLHSTSSSRQCRPPFPQRHGSVKQPAMARFVSESTALARWSHSGSRLPEQVLEIPGPPRPKSRAMSGEVYCSCVMATQEIVHLFARNK